MEDLRMSLDRDQLLGLPTSGTERPRILLAKFLWHLRDHPIRLPAILWKNLIYPLTPSWSEQKFDRSLGIDTRRFQGAAELGSPGERAGAAIDYDPSPPAVLRRLLDAVGDRAEGFTFVDFGAGKGRVMLLAARYPFARVAGVEWSEPLYRLACSNIGAVAARNPNLAPMEIAFGNATEYVIPETPCVLYFFNPFDLTTIQRIAERIRESLARAPRKIIIISYSPPEVSQIFEMVLGPANHTVPVPRQRRFRRFEAVIFESPELRSDPRMIERNSQALEILLAGPRASRGYALLYTQQEPLECDYILNLTSLDEAYETAERLHRSGRIAEMIFQQRGESLEFHTGKIALQKILSERVSDRAHFKSRE
jgi:hypothetical protein